MSSLLSRNYYTIAHDLNPSDEKHEKQGPFDDSAIVYTADEPSFLNTVKLKLILVSFFIEVSRVAEH